MAALSLLVALAIVVVDNIIVKNHRAQEVGFAKNAN